MLIIPSAQSWSEIQVALFDLRWDGKRSRCLLGVCLPTVQLLYVYCVYPEEDKMKVELKSKLPALSIVSIRGIRDKVRDLLVLSPDGQSFTLLTYGIREIPIRINHPSGHGTIVSLTSLSSFSNVLLTYQDGYRACVDAHLFPQDMLTLRCFHTLSRLIQSDTAFSLHTAFLSEWQRSGRATSESFASFEKALEHVFELEGLPEDEHAMDDSTPFAALANSKSHHRFSGDKAFKTLSLPGSSSKPRNMYSVRPHRDLHPDDGAAMLALQLLAEELRLQLDFYLADLRKMAILVCRFAVRTRPEWVDYWKRRLPTLQVSWPSPALPGKCPNKSNEYCSFCLFQLLVPDYPDQRIPVWPPDFYAILQAIMREGIAGFPQGDGGRMRLFANPNLAFPALWPDVITETFNNQASLEYGSVLPLEQFQGLYLVFRQLSDIRAPTLHVRAEHAVVTFYQLFPSPGHLNTLPMGLAAPIREAIRTCMGSPPQGWNAHLLNFVGRNDLAATVTGPDLWTHGYRSRKHFLDMGRPLYTMGGLIRQSRLYAQQAESVAGVEMHDDDLAGARFPFDKRLDEASRMLNSSVIPIVRTPDRPELR